MRFNKLKIIYFIFLISCALGYQKQDESVDLEFEKKEQIIIQDDVEVEVVDLLGPANANHVFSNKESDGASPVFALHVADTGYHFGEMISLLKIFESKNVNVSIISGEGLGALAAALYAKYKDSSVLEWKLLELTQKLQDHQMFGEEWLNEIKLFVRKEFFGQRTTQLKTLLGLPSVNYKCKLVFDADIYSKLIYDIDIKNHESLSSFYCDKGIDLKKSYADKADFYLSVRTLSNKLSFNNINDYAYGVISKRFYLISHSDKYKSINFQQYEYDNFIGSPMGQIERGEVVSEIERKALSFSQNNN